MQRALHELPEVDADFGHWEHASRQGDRGHDVQVDLHVAGKSFVLLIAFARTEWLSFPGMSAR
ncbi:MAG TPA: hypothetical protein VHK24_07570 [Steroidobacter sp.]|nr:hypothetical protein [Steroidobacter sp.]